MANIPHASRIDGYKFKPEELQHIHVSDNLVRFEPLDESWVEWLAGNIASRGQDDPVLFRRRMDGQPEITDGRHRFEAVKRINADPSKYGLAEPVPLTATYKPMNDDEAIVASFMGNTSLKLSAMDRAATIHRLVTIYKWDRPTIVEKLNTSQYPLSASRISQLLQLMQLPYDVQIKVHRGELSEQAARAILDTSTNAQEAIETAQQVAEKEVSPKKIIKKARDKKRAAGRCLTRSKDDLVELLCEIGSDAANTLMAWFDGDTTVSDDQIIAIFIQSTNTQD